MTVSSISPKVQFSKPDQIVCCVIKALLYLLFLNLPLYYSLTSFWTAFCAFWTVIAWSFRSLSSETIRRKSFLQEIPFQCSVPFANTDINAWVWFWRISSFSNCRLEFRPPCFFPPFTFQTTWQELLVILLTGFIVLYNSPNDVVRIHNLIFNGN